MHDLSEQMKRALEIVTGALFGFAALTIDQIAAGITIGAGLVSMACGAVRLVDWFERRRASRG